ncbi:hypothetical protein LA080_001186 [Diaporthe eres]|nr:hypothetical protein LA080_001186 [Diaporthe eres]
MGVATARISWYSTFITVVDQAAWNTMAKRGMAAKAGLRMKALVIADAVQLAKGGPRTPVARVQSQRLDPSRLLNSVGGVPFSSRDWHLPTALVERGGPPEARMARRGDTTRPIVICLGLARHRLNTPTMSNWPSCDGSTLASYAHAMVDCLAYL